MATANSRRNNDARNDDLYTTPQFAVEALLKHESFTGCVRDPGCGLGDISKVFIAGGHSDVDSFDLYDHGYGETGIDYLDIESVIDNTVMNPPFKLLSEFILKALETTKNKVAVFARINCLETKDRYDFIYKETPPSRVYLFVHRVKCHKGGVDDGQSSAVLYCWQVWDYEKRPFRKTELIWLDDKPPKPPRKPRKPRKKSKSDGEA